MLDARWSFHGLNQIFIGDRVSSSFERTVERPKRSTNEGCWILCLPTRTAFNIFLWNSNDRYEIFFSAKILEISIEFRCNPCCIFARCILVIDDRFEEILYRSRADFAFRMIFHSLLKKVVENCWTKKLSRDIFLDCIPVLRLHYQMWNIFMVSP